MCVECDFTQKQLLAGYFPSCLRSEYPDGVPVRLVDRSDRTYAPDVGRSVGTLGGAHAAHDTYAPEQPQTASQFLDRLPKAVVRGGRMVPVRDEVAALLAPKPVARARVPVSDPLHTASQPHADHCTGARIGGQSAQTQPVLAAATCDMSALGSGADETQPGSECRGSAMVTLQVKREDGAQVYILKMRANDSMRSVYAALRKYRDTQVSAAARFELCSAYPACTCGETDETLAELGLAPNATLLMKAFTARA